MVRWLFLIGVGLFVIAQFIRPAKTNPAIDQSSAVESHVTGRSESRSDSRSFVCGLSFEQDPLAVVFERRTGVVVRYRPRESRSQSFEFFRVGKLRGVGTKGLVERDLR